MAKHLQFLRNATISTSRSAAKTALLAKLATLLDGEVAINRYQDGNSVKVLLGFNSTVGSGTKQFIFDSDAIPADVQTALNAITGDTGSIAKSIKSAIEALDVAAIGGTGKVITTVSEADGKISATAIDLKAVNVATTATGVTDDKVAVKGTTVEAQIGSLATSIKDVSKDLDSRLSWAVID